MKPIIAIAVVLSALAGAYAYAAPDSVCQTFVNGRVFEGRGFDEELARDRMLFDCTRAFPRLEMACKQGHGCETEDGITETCSVSGRFGRGSRVFTHTGPIRKVAREAAEFACAVAGGQGCGEPGSVRCVTTFPPGTRKIPIQFLGGELRPEACDDTQRLLRNRLSFTQPGADSRITVRISCRPDGRLDGNIFVGGPLFRMRNVPFDGTLNRVVTQADCIRSSRHIQRIVSEDPRAQISFSDLRCGERSFTGSLFIDERF